MAFFFLFYFTSRNSRYENLQVTIMKKLKLRRCLKTKRSRYGLRRKKISEVSEFLILPYTQNRNLGNPEICLFLQILTVVINQDLKIWTERQTIKFRYDLKEKVKISEISEVSLLPYTQDRKLGNLGNFIYLELRQWLYFKI